MSPFLCRQINFGATRLECYEVTRLPPQADGRVPSPVHAYGAVAAEFSGAAGLPTLSTAADFQCLDFLVDLEVLSIYWLLSARIRYPSPLLFVCQPVHSPPRQPLPSPFLSLVSCTFLTRAIVCHLAPPRAQYTCIGRCVRARRLRKLRRARCVPVSTFEPATDDTGVSQQHGVRAGPASGGRCRRGSCGCGCSLG